MESKKIIISVVLIILSLGVLSVLNTTISGNFTGGAILDFSGEYPGMGVIFILVFGLIGMVMLIKHHKKSD